MIFQIFIFLSLYHLYALQDITGGTFINNKYSTAEILLVKQNVGPKMCVKNCLRINARVAVNYIRAELRCELLLGTTSSSGLQEMDGSDYTEMTQWQMMKGPCFPNPCSDPNRRTKCIEVNEAEHICIQVATCPSGWVQFNGKCYYFSDFEKDWFGAKSFCESEGMMLAEPRSEEEIAVLRNTASNKQGDFLLGGTDRHKEGNWVWANSMVEISIFDWASGEPNNYMNNDHCLEILSTENFKWNDRNCDAKRRFICEKLLS